ncbi:MAG: hypothetical protein RIS70_555 [Planctomycetota bacterium]
MVFNRIETMSNIDANLFPVLCFLATFVASLIAVMLYGLNWLRLSRPLSAKASRVSNLIASGLSLVVACVLVSDAVVHLRGEGPLRDQFVAFILLAIAMVAVSVIHVYFGLRRADKESRGTSLLSVLPLFLALASFGWSASRFYVVAAVMPLEDWNLPVAPPGAQYVIEDFMVVTDKGNRLPLFGWNVSDEDFHSFSTVTEKNFQSNFQSIRRETSDEESNCHGWVFTEGKYLLFGEQVEEILRENGYQVVAKPAVGDVIIYRSHTGAILHSGLVQSVFGNGEVLIESKWGISARYLHLPKDQPYGELFQYYHSERGKHSVCIVAGSDESLTSIAGWQAGDPPSGFAGSSGFDQRMRVGVSGMNPGPGMPANNPKVASTDVRLGFAPPRMPRRKAGTRQVRAFQRSESAAGTIGSGNTQEPSQAADRVQSSALTGPSGATANEIPVPPMLEQATVDEE